MVTDDRTCYYPLGTEAPDNVPCGSEENTSCCRPGDICLDNGLCISVGQQPYSLWRGACTNKEWTGCTPHCSKLNLPDIPFEAATGDEPRLIMQLEYSSPEGGALLSIIYSWGSTSQYCCGAPKVVDSEDGGAEVGCFNDSDNGAETFELESANVVYGRALLSNISTTAPTETQAPSETQSSSPTDISSGLGGSQTCHNAAIGAGVGVPLGVLALLLLIWAMLERKWKSELRQSMSNVASTSSVAAGTSLGNTSPGANEVSGISRKLNQVSELEDGGRPELSGDTRYGH
ncbi:hypothetical protein N7519_004124 [Penicillium mononematosum]|uniref:uncharacterized protein n=1 Tax=Penicillium mononematosum TaxID=268346 RepID=UPI0025484F5D|nr:uncharacterized protein N7519_004124 [Penicillium mononematosum]KAJ6189216.1 hypothetical protein N7519_004124 [Penicillium mononematosum]